MRLCLAPGGRQRQQAGLTLIELLIAITLGLLVTLAAVASLLVGRQGFTSVDQSSQLRENARFAASLIQRVVIQAGYESHRDGTLESPWRYFCSGGIACGDIHGDKNPGVRGFDNALVPDDFSVPGELVGGNRSQAACGASDTSCVNGSDVLAVRYWGDSRAGADADGSMINCSGSGEKDDVAPAYSIFHVRRSASGEPTLACTYRDADGKWQTVPLVQGVEGFQVLYGTDSVTPNAAPPAAGAAIKNIPTRYLRASELTVATDADATMDNWRRVRSVRIGLLLRGEPNSAVDRASSGGSYEVLGTGFSDPKNDPGSALDVVADGRLRQNLVFTVHLRNRQYVLPPP